MSILINSLESKSKLFQYCNLDNTIYCTNAIVDSVLKYYSYFYYIK